MREGPRSFGTFAADCVAPWFLPTYHRFARRRPRDGEFASAIPLENSTVSEGRGHHLTPDVHYWRGAYWAVYASSPWHIGSSKSRVVIRRSEDGVHWETKATFSFPNGDIRDPKLFGHDDTLRLFVLRNDSFVAEPNDTWAASSKDGSVWTSFYRPSEPGWLFWKPVFHEGMRLWYATAYWHGHGRSKLFSSVDGEKWESVSAVYQGDRNDETAVVVDADGALIVTARLEVSDSFRGHSKAGTWIARSEAPFTKWTGIRCSTTRLDGPSLFLSQGRVFAAGRRHGVDGKKDRVGSYFSRKRTAIYEFDDAGLRWLFDLPSGGDTGYAGTVVREGKVAVCYYTSPIAEDPVCLSALFLPTEVRFVSFSEDSLAAVSRGGNA